MTENQKQTILKWRSRYKRAQLAHSYTAISYGRYHQLLGVLLIVLTTTSCVLIFATHEYIPAWLSPSVGILAALFAYLQTFLQLAEKGDSHREVARRYGSIKKELEYLLDFEIDSKSLTEKVNIVRKKEDEIAKDAPHALSHQWKKAKAQTQKENDSTSIRCRP